MPGTTLDQRREQMIRFLLENIVAREIKRVDNDVVFTDKRKFPDKREKRYYIKTLSKPDDLPYDFEIDSARFDNDGRRLHTICKAVASFIQEQNSQVG